VPSTTLRAVDLFAGCGGLSVGLKMAGFNVLAAVEYDVGAIEAYKANHPDVPNIYGYDIRRLSGLDVLKGLRLKRGELELLAGCPPCQGFSRMRTLNRGEAAEDPRNDLVSEYLRLVQEIQPRALMFENVPGIARDQRYRELLLALHRLGYATVDRVHDASHFGVPQRRRRLIMLGTRGHAVKIPEPERGSCSSTVRTAIAHLPAPGASGDPAHDVVESRRPEVTRLIALIPSDGGSRKDVGPAHTLPCHQRCDGFHDVYGRMRWDAVSPTITSGFVNPSKGRFLHPVQDRCITPREAALLQTFPPGYHFPMGRGKYAVARMIGNAFPPELARYHALAVAAALGVPA
jgi:DNA (cytosine-5)-methyltransferase 1